MSIEKLCSVTTSEGQVVPAEIEDASINGLRLAVNEALQPGAECILLLTPEVDKEIEVRGTVVAKTENGCNIEISAIRADSFEHWRELIIDHAEDGYEMDTEITSRMDIWPDTY
ncbi:MAG: hypothetical protein GWP08_19725 [Nitrospiraceae bacterium]|nr:hypothetical protein [Nitrospiraceae bacterium]